MSLHNGRMYLVVVDDRPDTHAVAVPADSALDACRYQANIMGFGETLHEGATALGRWTIATADEHRVSAWLAPWDGTIGDDEWRIAAGLVAFEAEVLIALVGGTPKRWGAAAGQAYEVLRSRGCVTELFAATHRGRAVAQARVLIDRAREIGPALDDLERNVLRAVEHGPIMEADIGPTEPQVNALVDKGLLHWRPEGCVYTDLGRALMVAATAVTP